MNASQPWTDPLQSLEHSLPHAASLPAGVAALVAICLLLSSLFPSKPSSLAPGPEPSWLVGHTFQVPTEKTWLYFHSLALKYGPLVGLSLAGASVLVLDRAEDAEELLTRRSANYSSRKQLVYAGKYRSHDKRLILLPYGPELKRQRAAVYQMVNAKIVGSYERILQDGAMKMLLDIIDQPDSAYTSLKTFTASTLYRLVYGKNFKEENDEDLGGLLKILKDFTVDMHPAAHLVDTFPVLDKLPSFLTPWKKVAITKGNEEMNFYRRLLREVKQRMDAGEHVECFAARLIENWDNLKLDEDSIAYVAGSAFEAGTDNAAGTVLWFLVAAMNFPETVYKAQAELDRVLGADGLTPPDFEHLELLPYSVAMTKEVLRWMPVAPCCAPHQSEKEDTYKGYYIPANTLVIPNIWAMHHNEEIYPDSFTFNPDRFMPKDGSVLTGESLIEGHYGFGFGRRVCPGQYLAAKSVWIAVVQFLWAFNITPPQNASGGRILPDPGACRHGLTAEPERIKVVLKPRSEAHVQVIKQSRLK